MWLCNCRISQRILTLLLWSVKYRKKPKLVYIFTFPTNKTHLFLSHDHRNNILMNTLLSIKAFKKVEKGDLMAVIFVYFCKVQQLTRDAAWEWVSRPAVKFTVRKAVFLIRYWLKKSFFGYKSKILLASNADIKYSISIDFYLINIWFINWVKRWWLLTLNTLLNKLYSLQCT